MPEQTLRRFLHRLNKDTAFRDRAVADPEAAFAAFGISLTEQTAITSGDEDALRRLAGADVSGFLAGSSVMVSVHVRCVPHQPGTGTGGGTGTGHEDGTGPRRLAGTGW